MNGSKHHVCRFLNRLIKLIMTQPYQLLVFFSAHSYHSSKECLLVNRALSGSIQKLQIPLYICIGFLIPLRQQWLEALGIEETDLPKDPRVCSRHFSDGDATKLPSLTLGKKFASPKKRSAPVRIPIPPTKRCKVTSSISISSSCESNTVLSTNTSQLPSTSSSKDDAYLTVNAALMAKIEMLGRENAALKQEVCTKEKARFRLEDVKHDDSLVKMYTGFHYMSIIMSYWWHFLIFWHQLLTTLTTGELKIVFTVVRKNITLLTVYF